MKVYALVGESGTGKSYKALELMNTQKIEYLIDDGILISEGRWIAGKSAKREDTVVTAVKRAIFHFDDHAKEVREEIERRKPKSILLVGTSDKMVGKIARKLGIEEIHKTFYIDEISSQQDLEKAKYYRQVEGKHVIPLPSMQVRKSFSGYMILKLRGIFNSNAPIQAEERTIVRPTFSYIGNYSISKRAVTQIVAFTVMETKKMSVERTRIIETQKGIEVTVDVKLLKLEPLEKVAVRVQRSIILNLERMCGINVQKVNVNIVNINVT